MHWAEEGFQVITRRSAAACRAASASLHLVPATLLVLLLLASCAAPFDRIDRSLASEARLALFQERPPHGDDSEEENIEPYEGKVVQTRSVILGELLAIFPGFFWHGLGHQYAGDARTA